MNRAITSRPSHACWGRQLISAQLVAYFISGTMCSAGCRVGQGGAGATFSTPLQMLLKWRLECVRRGRNNGLNVKRLQCKKHATLHSSPWPRLWQRKLSNYGECCAQASDSQLPVITIMNQLLMLMLQKPWLPLGQLWRALCQLSRISAAASRPQCFIRRGFSANKKSKMKI